MITNLLLVLYMIAMLGASSYGLYGFITLFYHQQYAPKTPPIPALPANKMPAVTVQLPIYNERLVAQRLIQSVVALEYPPELLQIQVLDDSTDETTDIVAQLVNHYQQKGINIQHIHRSQRTGFKAGALQNGLKKATGEFIAIFDADFTPLPHFLQQAIPHFVTDEQLGMLQTRWGHLNEGTSPLTRMQAMCIDKHFVMDQWVRYRANLFPKFNGSAGIWRRACLDDIGGWQGDTMTEDLCLSTRAVLNGWQGRFLNDVISPAELPTSISAYKNQQARWTKGAVQCFTKYQKDIRHSIKQRLSARFYGIYSFLVYAANFCLLASILLLVPLVYLDVSIPPYFFFFAILSLGQPLAFLLSQRLLYPHDWWWRYRYFLLVMIITIGILPSNSRAIWQALTSKHHTFVRTPKGKANAVLASYHVSFDWIVLVELFFATYAGIGLLVALYHQNIGAFSFLLYTCLGLGYVAYLTLKEQWQS